MLTHIMGMASKRMAADQRLSSKIRKGGADECWEWTGTKNNAGYGMITWWDQKQNRWAKRLAHRLNYELHCGPIPAGRLACHRCDNPGCVNPSHLYIGDYRRNALDAVERGRHRHGTPKRHADGTLMHPPPILRGDDHPYRKNPALARRGEDIGTSKLTAEDVATIYKRRMAGETGHGIARSLGMDASTILDICNGERWSHLLSVNGNPTLAELQALPKGTAPTLLNESIVRAIRADFASGMTGVAVAEKYGITKQTASEIRTYKTWKAVTQTTATVASRA